LSRKLHQLEQANAELAEREARFRTLAAAAPVGILQLDPAGRHLYANAQWDRLVGATEPWSEAVHPDDRPRAQVLWDDVVRSGQEASGEFRLGAADGPPAWALVQLKPLCAAGALQGFLVIVTDLTAEKLLAQEKADLSARLYLTQKLESLGTLVTGIAHEFNNL